MKILPKSVLFAFALISVNVVKAQDPLFTQVTSAPQYLNPALVGTDTNARVDLAYRLQWPKLSGNFNTFFGSYQQYISCLNGYAGINYMYDYSSALTTQRITLQYAQNIRLGKKCVIRPAFQAAWFNRTLDWSKLTFGDMIDPRRGFVYQTGEVPRAGKVNNFDFSAGTMFYWNQLYLGVAVQHLTQPNESVIQGKSPLPMKLGTQIGYNLHLLLGPRCILDLMPYFYYTSQSTFNTYMAGANLQFNRHIIVGAGFRKDDAVLMNAGYQHKFFRLVYSYDYTKSSNGLNNATTGGAHEISLAIFFWKQKANKHFVKTWLPT